MQVRNFSACADEKLETSKCKVEGGVSLQWADKCPAGFLSVTLLRASKSDGSAKHTIPVQVGEKIRLGRHTYKPVACFIHSGNPESGHYYLLSEECGNWLKYDDDKPVCVISPSSFPARSVEVVIYEQVQSSENKVNFIPLISHVVWNCSCALLL